MLLLAEERTSQAIPPHEENKLAKLCSFVVSRSALHRFFHKTVRCVETKNGRAICAGDMNVHRRTASKVSITKVGNSHNIGRSRNRKD